MKKDGFADYPFSFHDSEELGPAILAKISKKTGLRPEDLMGAYTVCCLIDNRSLTVAARNQDFRGARVSKRYVEQHPSGE